MTSTDAPSSRVDVESEKIISALLAMGPKKGKEYTNAYLYVESDKMMRIIYDLAVERKELQAQIEKCQHEAKTHQAQLVQLTEAIIEVIYRGFSPVSDDFTISSLRGALWKLQSAINKIDGFRTWSPPVK